MKIFERLAVGRVCAQRLKPLKVKKAAVNAVGTGLSDDIDNATSGSSELCAGPCRDDLKLLNGFQGNVDRRSLATGLLAKEPVIVVAAVKADVVEGAALPCEVYLITIGPLSYADAGRQSKQVFELPSEDRQV